MNKYIIYIAILLLPPSTSFSTSSQGNSGFEFIGFSKDGKKVAYLKFIEHYGMINTSYGKTYYHDYVGTYVFDIESSSETLYSDRFNFSVKGFKAYDKLETEDLFNKSRLLRNKFKIGNNENLLFDNDVIYQEKKGYLKLMLVSILNDFNRVVIHIRITSRGEYDEKIMLFDVKKKKIRELFSSGNLVDRD